jgi:type IV pilus assembly protein PilC
MPTFSYVAVNEKNNPVNGTIDQLDRSGAIDALTKQGLRPISLKEVKVKESKFKVKNLLGKEKIKSDQLVMFTRQLSAMISAGVPILRALTAMSTHVAESPLLKKILTGIIHDIESGMSLGNAMSKYPDTFDDVYVNMVRAGEAAGILDEILKRLALQQEKSTSMRKKIKGSMMYPIVLLVITVLAFFGLMLFVVPQIGKILTDLGGPDAELPFITKMMLSISHFIIAYWYVILIVFGGGLYGIMMYIRTSRGKFQFHTLILKIPVIKKIIIKIAVARFSRTFSALMEAGVAVLEALDVTSRAVGNKVYEKALVDAEEKVKNGRSLSSIIESYDIFPPIVAQMLLVGEETGQTDRVLIKIADYYEEEVEAAIDGLGSIIEPIMIVIMGSMVGLIAASVMLPIAGLAQSIK